MQFGKSWVGFLLHFFGTSCLTVLAKKVLRSLHDALQTKSLQSKAHHAEAILSCRDPVRAVYPVSYDARGRQYLPQMTTAMPRSLYQAVVHV